MADAIRDLARHVVRTAPEDVPADAIAAARVFILDTLGVGIVGSAGPMAGALVRAASGMGQGRDARVWGTGERLPAASAALCNAYRVHCQEFDCVHEAAVAHVMTIVLPAALALAERGGGVTGARLVTAVVLGVDVAASLGIAAASGLRFFRPATVGAFGGVAAMGRLLGFDEGQMVHAFSLAYGQICGTMQAHTEGSGLLAMQMAFNARNAVTACDLAAAGFTGPEQVLEGDFGYFRLIEDGGDLAPVIGALGRRWRITEIAHKPYPSGRATHGIIDACLALRDAHGIDPSAVEKVEISVPPLIEHLVGRPPKRRMAINYARLCARYTAACALIGGRIVLDDFSDAAYLREQHQALAARIALDVRGGEDPNALSPVTVRIRLAGGRSVDRTVEEVYGTPGNPMSRRAQLAKFLGNCANAARPIAGERAEALVAAVDGLMEIDDAARLVDLTIAPEETQ